MIPEATSSATRAVLESLAAACPVAVRSHVLVRMPGSSMVYSIDDYWSLTHYTMPTRIHLPEDKRDLHVRSGSVVLFPPSCRRSFHLASSGLHRAVHVLPPQAVPYGGPWHWPASPASARLASALDEVIRDHHPHRRLAGAWRALWLLVDLVTVEQPGEDALQQAVDHITNHLPDPLRAADIAGIVGMSHNQLLRLFRHRYGCGIAAYIRERRMALASDLLCHSDLSISAIAAEVGIPDRQHFNKTVRRHFGQPPSALRMRGGFPGRDIPIG